MHVPERIKYKIAVLTYRVVHGLAPWYLGPFTRVADLPSRQSLRTVGTNRLVVPTSRLSTVGSRAFPVAGPQPDLLFIRNCITETCSCTLSDGVHSEWFQVLSGVCQGCTFAPDIFLNPKDLMLNRTVEQTPLGVSIGEESFTDLDYTV